MARRVLPFHQRVWAVTKRIPRGKIASYGLVARLAGAPNSARHVGFALRLGRGLPWWRVLAKDGRIVIMNPEVHKEQVERLRKEGVTFDEDGRVDVARHTWQPPGAVTRRPAAPSRSRPRRAPRG